MKNFVFTFLFSLITFLGVSQNNYEQLKAKYDKFRKEEKQDSALYFAKKLNSWLLINESDTSFKYAVSFRYIASVYVSTEIFDSAKINYLRSLFFLEKLSKINEIEVAKCLNSLGTIFRILGDYKSAEPLLKRAVEIRKRLLGENDSDYAFSLSSLANLYLVMGDYKSAEVTYTQALEILKKNIGDNHHIYATYLNNLGILYIYMGDYKSAELMLMQSLDIRYKILGQDHPDYASSLNNLGNLYSEMGDYNNAEYLYKRCIEVREKILGQNHPNYISSLYNLANNYSELGDYKSSGPYYEKYIELASKILGENNSDYANSLIGISNWYLNKHDYKKADSLFMHSIKILKSVVGENHPDYFLSLVFYANYLEKRNLDTEAFGVYNDVFYKKSKYIMDNFEWLSDSQVNSYWRKEMGFYDNVSWFANQIYLKVPSSIGLNYNSLLAIKSRLLEAKISTQSNYLNYNINLNNKVNSLREELSYRKRMLAKMESDGSIELEKMGKILTEADSLDKCLTLSWPEYAQQKKNLSITWDQVQQNIDNNEAAIEFVRYKNEDDSLYYYNALIIRKNDKYPVLVQLCPEKKLLGKQPQYNFDSYYSLIWQPLEAYLKDIKTIYYSPVGELNNLPFHAFKTEDDEYLMDRYSLHQLTSTRYLAMGLKQKEKEPIPLSITMVGGVNYDYLPNTNTELANNNKKNKSSRSGPDAKKLDYLAGTKKEVENINTTLTSLKWSTDVFENNDATEENIMKQEGKEAKGVLHISTHGYAFPEFNFNDSTINKNSLRYSYRYSQNPMVRSGLILTGGNWAWMGSDTLTKMGAEQNGILTALEVSQLNLRKTKLVVLSACETGLGKIEGSEGTFGLKRAFKLAGVENIIVSLWSVPDDQTMELMTIFYTDLAKTLNPVVSFAKAQKDMRNKYPYQPALWSGFVLVR